MLGPLHCCQSLSRVDILLCRLVTDLCLPERVQLLVALRQVTAYCLQLAGQESDNFGLL